MEVNPRPRVWTTKTYDRLARYYDGFMKLFFPVGEEGREKIVQRLGPGSVLDVACGTGTLLCMAQDKGLACNGIDLSIGMLEQARVKLPTAALQRGSYYAIPFRDRCFDHVVATNALSGVHIDAQAVLIEMIRVCMPGGKICIAEWQIVEKETLVERLLVKLASFNDDAPKDYQRIFRELGYEPQVESLGKHLTIFSIKREV